MSGLGIVLRVAPVCARTKLSSSRLLFYFDWSCESRGLAFLRDVSGLLNPLCAALVFTLSPTPRFLFDFALFLLFLGHSSLSSLPFSVTTNSGLISPPLPRPRSHFIDPWQES